ncbi:ATP-dependent DNA ligase [Jatrophihabitans sp. DSM 45814]
MTLQAVAATSDSLGLTPGRGAKVEQLVALLTDANPVDAAVVVSWLSGELTQRQIGVGWASLRELGESAPAATLTVQDVETIFAEIGALAGEGSQGRRRTLLQALFAAATATEQAFLKRLLTGDLRQGALAGLMTDAVARAARLPIVDVRRAAMLSGDLSLVARQALQGGDAALAAFHLQVGRPVSPMLAQSAVDTDDALQRLRGQAAFEWKLDGARIQIHRAGNIVRIFTRSLDDVTARMPEVVDAVLALPVRDLVADGEVISLRADGRPQPFQVTASRIGSRATAAAGVGLRPFLFDVLHVDGVDVLDEPMSQRMLALDAIVPDSARVPRLVTSDPAMARAFLDDALAHGHEGVVAKSLSAPYEAGRRGAGWLKVKPVHTLDLVVLAVEWGSGRRKGRLSNIHLGAREQDGDGFVMLGKTFKGMTDAMLAWQTERFLSLAEGPTDQWVVTLRPEQVVEIAFDGVQRSSRYPGGVALRFARVVRYRDDKPPAEADTIDTVQSFLQH